MDSLVSGLLLVYLQFFTFIVVILVLIGHKFLITYNLQDFLPFIYRVKRIKDIQNTTLFTSIFNYFYSRNEKCLMKKTLRN